jgi:Asp-tRNA(Asn)/Glu-tRNA(Gln) amidotransferase A subunit family amidase
MPGASDLIPPKTGHALLSATAASAAIHAGTLTSEALVTACLERIAQREGEVQAWAFIDPELALAQARALDREPKRSWLHGIPVGIKDVIDTCDMPTGYGSPIYQGHRPVADAACVAQIRELGGVILGKTVSTEFATRHPNKTRNPHRLTQTPGGSSSGSGAAVADYMVPLALGTQTSSSVIRPAAYCGVVGYKPGFGLINRAGMKFLAESLDTIGVLSRTVSDAGMLAALLSGLPVGPQSFKSSKAPRIGLCRTPWFKEASPSVQQSLLQCAERFRKAGAAVDELELPPEFAELNDVQIRLSAYEFFRALSHERIRHPELISASLTQRIAAGSRVTRQQYEAAVALMKRCQRWMEDKMSAHELLMAPSAPSEAPDIAGTGEPTFGLMWTLLQMPCMTLPCGSGEAGLPVGVQLIAACGNDTGLYRDAAWAEAVLSAS